MTLLSALLDPLAWVAADTVLIYFLAFLLLIGKIVRFATEFSSGNTFYYFITSQAVMKERASISTWL